MKKKLFKTALVLFGCLIFSLALTAIFIIGYFNCAFLSDYKFISTERCFIASTYTGPTFLRAINYDVDAKTFDIKEGRRANTALTPFEVAVDKDTAWVYIGGDYGFLTLNNVDGQSFKYIGGREKLSKTIYSQDKDNEYATDIITGETVSKSLVK